MLNLGLFLFNHKNKLRILLIKIFKSKYFDIIIYLIILFDTVILAFNLPTKVFFSNFAKFLGS